MILIPFKKVDEIALVPRRKIKVTIPIFDEHRKPSSSVCCFVIHKVGTHSENHSVAFCSFYTQLRLPLAQNDAFKQQMPNLLCTEHFNGFLSDTKYKHIDKFYEVPLHPYHLSGPEVIIEPPTMITNTKPVAVKLKPQQGGSQYKSILEEFTFDVLEVLTDCTKVGNKIPKILPNLAETTKL